jgi:hypothetical protein
LWYGGGTVPPALFPCFPTHEIEGGVLVSLKEHLFGVFADSLAGSFSGTILIGVVKISGFLLDRMAFQE